MHFLVLEDDVIWQMPFVSLVQKTTKKTNRKLILRFCLISKNKKMKKHLRILNKLPIFHVKEVEKSDKNVISNFLNWVNFFFFI